MPTDKKELLNTVAMRYNADYNVVQANELIRSKQDDLTLLEAKIVRLAISQILKDDNEFNTYRCDIVEFAEFLGVSKDNIYRDAQNIGRSLLKKVIRIKTGTDKNGKDNYKLFQWVSFFEYKDGIITIKLHDNLKPYLIGLDKLFTQYQYSQILSLPTTNAIRLYELLVSFVNMTFYEMPEILPNGSNLEKGEFAFSIDYLRKYFNCEDKYPNAGDFIKRVIDASVNALNENTVMPVSYRTVKRKRSITAIIFKLNEWTDEYATNLLNRLRGESK